MDPAADGADRNADNLRDLLVTKSFHLFENQDGPILIGQGVQGVVNDTLRLGLHQGFGGVGPRSMIGRLETVTVSRAVERLAVSLRPAFPAKRRVHRDAEKPRREGRVSLESIEFLVGVDKGVLGGFASLFGRPEHP